MSRVIRSSPKPAGRRASVLLLCGFLGVLLIGHGTAGRGAPEGAHTMAVATSKSRARHCAHYKPGTLRALADGSLRLVLVVHAFTPPDPRDGTLVVWLANDGMATPQEVARVAIHPVRAFTRAEGKDQRFAVSLAGQTALPAAGSPLCLEVGFDTAARSLQGGRAETEIVLEDSDRS